MMRSIRPSKCAVAVALNLGLSAAAGAAEVKVENYSNGTV